MFELILLIFLIVLSAFFSSSEVGMLSLNRYKLNALINKKNKNAIRVKNLLSKPDSLLSTILIGNNFANIFASAMATLIAVKIFGDTGVWIATLLLTLIILIFAEIAPKTLATMHPIRVAFIASYPLYILRKILHPVIILTNFLAYWFLRIFGIKLNQNYQQNIINAEELKTAVNETKNLPTEHQSILTNILDLEQISIDEIMIPVNDIIGINIEDSWDDISEQIANIQHTRIPLYENNINNVIGFLHTKTILKKLINEPLNKKILKSLVQPCYFVPKNTKLSTQLINFKNKKQRICLVVDEYGEILGLAVLEDILEEIIGEFTTDIASDIHKIIYPQKNGDFLIDGSASIREINKSLNINLPINEAKTISGLIIRQLEFIPNSNICLVIADYKLEIKQIRNNKIKNVLIKNLKKI